MTEVEALHLLGSSALGLHEEGPHTGVGDCPFWHDGCHCTVASLVWNCDAHLFYKGLVDQILQVLKDPIPPQEKLGKIKGIVRQRIEYDEETGRGKTCTP